MTRRLFLYMVLLSAIVLAVSGAKGSGVTPHSQTMAEDTSLIRLVVPTPSCGAPIDIPAKKVLIVPPPCPPHAFRLAPEPKTQRNGASE